MHPETRQLRELDAEEREQAIQLEISIIYVEIAAKNLHEEFVRRWYAYPAGDLADIVKKACLCNRGAQARDLGEWVQTAVSNRIRQVAEITVDGRLRDELC